VNKMAGILEDLLTYGAPQLGETLGAATGLAVAASVPPPKTSEGMSEEEIEDKCWEDIKLFGPKLGLSVSKAQQIVANYLKEDTAEGRKKFRRTYLAGLPSSLRTRMEKILDIQDKHFPPPGITPEKTFTRDELEQIGNVVAGKPEGLLPLWYYPNPLEKAKQQLPGLYARAPQQFEEYVNRLLAGQKMPEKWTPERIALEEVKEIPTAWRQLLQVKEEITPELYYRQREKVIADAKAEFADPRQAIALDYLISTPELYENFADLDDEFLKTIGIDSSTANVTTPEGLDEDVARLARKIIATNPTTPPTSGTDRLVVQAFLFGRDALPPTQRDAFDKLMQIAELRDQVEGAMGLPPIAPELEEVAPTPSRSKVMNLVFSSPNINKSKAEAIQNALTLRTIGITNDPTVAYILQVIGSPTAQKLIKTSGITEKVGKPDVATAFNEWRKANPDKWEKANPLKRIENAKTYLRDQGYSEEEIASIGL